MCVKVRMKHHFALQICLEREVAVECGIKGTCSELIILQELIFLKVGCSKLFSKHVHVEKHCKIPISI